MVFDDRLCEIMRVQFSYLGERAERYKCDTAFE